MPSPNLPFQLLVFDWDGTVVDSLASIVDCTLHGLRDLGFEAPPVSEIRAAVGLSREESLDRLFPGYSEADRARVVERNRHHWLETYRDRITPVEGAKEVIEGLADEGYLLAVATGKSRVGLEHDLDKCGLRQLFLATRTADDAASKPHPQMLLDLTDELGVGPRETLMVGDSFLDLQMAQNAGAAGLGVLTGSCGRADLSACGPLDVIDSVAEMPAWLEARTRGGGD